MRHTWCLFSMSRPSSMSIGWSSKMEKEQGRKSPSIWTWAGKHAVKTKSFKKQTNWSGLGKWLYLSDSRKHQTTVLKHMLRSELSLSGYLQSVILLKEAEWHCTTADFNLNSHKGSPVAWEGNVSKKKKKICFPNKLVRSPWPAWLRHTAEHRITDHHILMCFKLVWCCLE